MPAFHTYTMFSFSSTFYCLFVSTIANGILLNLFLLHVFIILCQFMSESKQAAPVQCAFVIIYTLTTSSYGKPGCGVDLPSEHIGSICPSHHYRDQMTINNCCFLAFQTALCQKRGAACFFFLKIDKPLSDIRDAIFRAYLFNSNILPVKIKQKQRNGMYF